MAFIIFSASLLVRLVGYLRKSTAKIAIFIFSPMIYFHINLLNRVARPIQAEKGHNTHAHNTHDTHTPSWFLPWAWALRRSAWTPRQSARCGCAAASACYPGSAAWCAPSAGRQCAWVVPAAPTTGEQKTRESELDR